MTDFKRLCLEQAEIINILQDEVHRLLTELAQYTDITEEEERLKTMEDNNHGWRS